MGDYGSYKKAPLARGLLGENSKEKISHRRKWLIGEGSWEQIACRSILGGKYRLVLFFKNDIWDLKCMSL
jgi:hypothetical protein